MNTIQREYQKASRFARMIANADIEIEEFFAEPAQLSEELKKQIENWEITIIK